MVGELFDGIIHGSALFLGDFWFFIGRKTAGCVSDEGKWGSERLKIGDNETSWLHFSASW